MKTIAQRITLMLIEAADTFGYGGTEYITLKEALVYIHPKHTELIEYTHQYVIENYLEFI